jgi:large subunit ribosomal protein L24e
MPNCSFCESPIPKGTGMMYVKKDGTLFNFCSSKCKKNNLDLGREGRRQKWTQAAKKFMARQQSKSEAAKAASAKGATGKSEPIKSAAKPEQAKK